MVLLWIGRDGTVVNRTGWYCCELNGMVLLWIGWDGTVVNWTGWYCCESDGMVLLWIGRDGTIVNWTGWYWCELDGMVLLWIGRNGTVVNRMGWYYCESARQPFKWNVTWNCDYSSFKWPHLKKEEFLVQPLKPLFEQRISLCFSLEILNIVKGDSLRNDWRIY